MFSVVKDGEGGGKLTNDVGRSPESFGMFSVVKHGEGGMGSKGAQLGAAMPLLRGKLTNDVGRSPESFENNNVVVSLSARYPV